VWGSGGRAEQQLLRELANTGEGEFRAVVALVGAGERRPRGSSSSFRELAGAGEGSSRRRPRGSNRSFRELAGAGEVWADALAEVRRRCGQGKKNERWGTSA
jgi:hypothetical protein